MGRARKNTPPPGTKHVPTDENRALVLEWASLMIPVERIARQLSVHRQTVERHYSDELLEGYGQADSFVGSALMALIRGGDTAATIFASKVRLLMRTQELKAITELPTIEFESDDPAEQLDQILRLTAKGEITLEAGQGLAGLIKAKIEMTELSAINERLAAIEESQRGLR